MLPFTVSQWVRSYDLIPAFLLAENGSCDDQVYVRCRGLCSVQKEHRLTGWAELKQSAVFAKRHISCADRAGRGEGGQFESFEFAI